MKILLPVFALLTGFVQAQPAPTAGELLDRMRKTYAEARTYRDRGSVTVEYLTRKKTDTTRRQVFSTAFQRGGAFRFAHVKPTPTGALLCEVVWASGTRTLAWLGYRKAVDSTRSLVQALVLAGASSGSASRRVSGLLMGDPKISMGWDQTLRNVRLLGQETVNNRTAYHLTATGGQPRLPSQLHLWLDAASGLIVRLAEHSQVAEFEALTTIDFEPDVNVELAPDLLRFDYQNCVK